MEWEAQMVPEQRFFYFEPISVPPKKRYTIASSYQHVDTGLIIERSGVKYRATGGCFGGEDAYKNIGIRDCDVLDPLDEPIQIPEKVIEKVLRDQDMVWDLYRSGDISPFVKEPTDLWRIVRSKDVQIRLKIERGEKISREEKNWLYSRLRSNTYFSLASANGGWRVDFSTFLKEYIVRMKHGWVETVYAPDKTSIRAYHGSHNVRDILEVVDNCACVAA